MTPSENLSNWRELLRKAERQHSLIETKARILSEQVREQGEELELTIIVAIATQSHILGFQANADQIEASRKQIEEGEHQVKQVNAQVADAYERLRHARSKVEEFVKHEESKKLLQKSWDELAVLDQRFGVKESSKSSDECCSDEETRSNAPVCDLGK